MKTHEDIVPFEAWLRLRLALVRYAELGLQQSPLNDIEAPLLIALACQEGDGGGYLNQKQLSLFLKKPKPAILSSAKSRLVKNGFCKELTSNERRALALPVNERTKYYRITDRGRKALAQHDRVTGALPSSVTEGVQNTPEYLAVLKGFDQRLKEHLNIRFHGIINGGTELNYR